MQLEDKRKVPPWEVFLERKVFLEEKMVELNLDGRRGLEPLESIHCNMYKGQAEVKKHLTIYRQTLPFSSLPCVAYC